MLCMFPDYYREFECLADKCEDTCCAGWKIGIDKESLKRYQKEKGNFGKKLRKAVYWKKRCFKQDKNKRCVLLDSNNLCSMQLNLGKSNLCKTCSEYPRHAEEFENRREMSLSISCPEAARILLAKEQPVTFYTVEKEESEKYETFDALLYRKLLEARELMREIVYNRELDPELRTGLILGLAHDMQVRVNKKELASCDKLFIRCRKEKALRSVEQKLEENKGNRTQKYALSKRIFRNLYRMELIHEEWNYHLAETENILYGQGNWGYEKLHEDFGAWLKAYMPEWQIPYEQLLIYFIYTYFCGAVYDNRIYSKTLMAVNCVWMIYEMIAARWKKNGGSIDMEDMVMVVYRFSRELEHSDYNLEIMENTNSNPGKEGEKFSFPKTFISFLFTD